MRKSLSLLIMESEKEHHVTLKSVVNIHDPSHLEKITSALRGHLVRKVCADRIIPFTGKIDKDLPEAPVGMPVYVVDIILGTLMCPREMAELIALYCGIDKTNFAILGDVKKLEESTNLVAGEDACIDNKEIQDGEMGEVKSAQKDVGVSRLDAFMKELAAERKKRETKTKTRPIYEAFVTSALEIRQMLPEGLIERGYWMVRCMNGNKTRVSVTGPYDGVPVGLSMVEGVARQMVPVRDGTRRIDHGSLTEYVIDLNSSDWAMISEETRPFQVRVKNTDTGKTYTAAVDASDEVQARNMGIAKIASTEGVPEENLLALDPTS